MKQEEIKQMFSHNLKVIRRINKLSQTQLAESIGVTIKKIGSWEEKRAIAPLEILKKICEKYSISNIDDLVFERFIGEDI